MYTPRTKQPFEEMVFTDDNVTPSAEFIEAKSLISSGKGWKKWPKIISKPVYEKIRDAVRICIDGFHLPDTKTAFDKFMLYVIDYYLEHGTLRPGYGQRLWELGLFAIFKRRIDEAIARRVRCIRAAALRRERREMAEKSARISGLSACSETPRPSGQPETACLPEYEEMSEPTEPSQLTVSPALCEPKGGEIKKPDKPAYDLAERKLYTNFDQSTLRISPEERNSVWKASEASRVCGVWPPRVESLR